MSKLLILIISICGLMLNSCYAKQPCGIHCNLSYIHLAQFEPAIGGLPSEVYIYYIASDGLSQESKETTDDYILSLKIGHVSIDAEFIDSVFDLANGQTSLNSPDPEVVYDSNPAMTRILICKDKGAAAFWEGGTAKVPNSIIKAISLIKSSIKRADTITLRDTTRFLRLRQISRHPSQLPRQSYIVPKPSELKPSSILSTAIKYPYRLIPIPKRDDLPFAYRRQPERPVSAVIEDVAYRIHFLKLSVKRKEGK